MVETDYVTEYRVEFKFDDNATGKFKKVSRSSDRKWNVMTYPHFITQEIEITHMLFFKKKVFIPLMEVTNEGNENLVGSYNGESIRKLYKEVQVKYKPILREKRLNNLLNK